MVGVGFETHRFLTPAGTIIRNQLCFVFFHFFELIYMAEVSLHVCQLLPIEGILFRTILNCFSVCFALAPIPFFLDSFLSNTNLRVTYLEDGVVC